MHTLFKPVYCHKFNDKSRERHLQENLLCTYTVFKREKKITAYKLIAVLLYFFQWQYLRCSSPTQDRETDHRSPTPVCSAARFSNWKAITRDTWEFILENVRMSVRSVAVVSHRRVLWMLMFLCIWNKVSFHWSLTCHVYYVPCNLITSETSLWTVFHTEKLLAS